MNCWSSFKKKNYPAPNVYSCEVMKLYLSLAHVQDIPMMLCSLGEGREEDGFPTRCDWKLENTEPVVAPPSPSPLEISFASDKKINYKNNTFHSASPWETMSI